MNFALSEDSKGHQTSEKKKNAYSARICLREWHQGFNSDSKPLECSCFDQVANFDLSLNPPNPK